MLMFVRSIKLMTYSRRRNGKSRNATLRKIAASFGTGPAAVSGFTTLAIRCLRLRKGEKLEIAGVACCPAAVDGEHVAIDVAVFRIGQEKGGDGNLIRRGGAAERYVVQHPLHVIPELAS